jgi:hypothetical protein
MKFEIYNYKKLVLGNDAYLTKIKHLNFECLYDCFKDIELKHETYDYILTSYKKINKHAHCVDTKFYFRQSYIEKNDFNTIKVFNCRFLLKGEEHEYLRKYPINKVIGIDRIEDNDFVYFYVKIENQHIQKVEPKKIPLITECVVCYENNKETLETGFFKCSHNSCCLECYNKLSIKICPICREKSKK